MVWGLKFEMELAEGLRAYPLSEFRIFSKFGSQNSGEMFVLWNGAGDLSIVC